MFPNPHLGLGSLENTSQTGNKEKIGNGNELTKPLFTPIAC